MWPLYLQTIGLVPAISGAKSATRHRNDDERERDIAELAAAEVPPGFAPEADARVRGIGRIAVGGAAEVRGGSRLGTVLMAKQRDASVE